MFSAIHKMICILSYRPSNIYMDISQFDEFMTHNTHCEKHGF